MPPASPLATLRVATPARILLPRTGPALATSPLLDFRLAQARARDAVHAPFVPPRQAAIGVASQATDRSAYLMRPDLGRRLDAESATLLSAHAGASDLAIVLADGLSPAALSRFAPPVLDALLPALDGWTLAPIVAAERARVALGDAIAAALGARAVLVLIGERPGLSTPESLGAYLTWAPGPATTDADRNCVSNIHDTGLAAPEAARLIAFLLEGARRLGRSGVALKDESGTLLLGGAA